MKPNCIFVAVFSMTLLLGTAATPGLSPGSDRPVIPHTKQSLAHLEMLLQEPDSIPPRDGITRPPSDPTDLLSSLEQRHVEGARSAAKSHLAKVGGDDITITDSTPWIPYASISFHRRAIRANTTSAMIAATPIPANGYQTLGPGL